MKIAFVSSEVFPYAKTGGLADVAGSLPKEIAALGHDIKVFTPKYNIFDESEYGLSYQWDIGEIPVRVNGWAYPVHVHKATMTGSSVEIYFIDCPHYFHRFRIYTNDTDEDERFILFQKAVIELLQRLRWAPDVIHCNDWQTSLIPLLLKDNYSWDRMFDGTATLLTIHNIEYQGRFAKDSLAKAEINEKYYSHGGPCEFGGGISFLKSGIMFAEIINTVSETYARELLTEELGFGMNNFLGTRYYDFYGILNGVDYNIWNPETDKLIPYNYSIRDLSGKLENKKFLLDHLKLPFNREIPLIGMISRLVAQKGFDIIAYALNQLMELPVQWVILGSGEHKYEMMFQNTAARFPGKVAVYLGFNNELAHLIEAGADIFLMPSHFEPCGLNQIYSLKYGTVPVVRKTGGLADTVQDWNEYLANGLETGTGYSFYDYSAHALTHAVQRAVNDFKLRDVWLKIQRNGMSQDYSWRRSAEKYSTLYERAKSKRQSS